MSSSLRSGRDGSLYIVGLGASTPVGRDAWSSAAAVRAGVSGFAEHPYMVDTAGEPMRLAVAPWLDIDYGGVRRFESLLFPAIEQSLSPLEGVTRRALGLVLALPARRPGLPADLERTLRASIVETFKDRFTVIASFENGHAGALLGMQAARKKIEQGAFDACVVAGVDSYIEPETLDWLEENDQIHGAGPLNNAWGFIPGEAAGAALLVSADTLQGIAAEPFAQLLGVGVGFEQNRIGTETVCIGEGLTAAFREALTGLPSGAKVTDVYCDMNGDPYRADEFGFACLRTKEAFQSASDFVAPADCWGDVSAASPPLAVVLSTIAARKAYAKGSFSFVWASSESGERGAALLALPLHEGT